MSSPSLPTGTATFLFSDIEGSTNLVRRVGDDAFAAIRADHRRILREAFAAQGGREIDTAGDGFFIAFDSARSAVLAAISAQLELATFIWPEDAEVRVRIGLHTADPTSPRTVMSGLAFTAQPGSATLRTAARSSCRTRRRASWKTRSCPARS